MGQPECVTGPSVDKVGTFSVEEGGIVRWKSKRSPREEHGEWSIGRPPIPSPFNGMWVSYLHSFAVDDAPRNELGKGRIKRQSLGNLEPQQLN